MLFNNLGNEKVQVFQWNTSVRSLSDTCVYLVDCFGLYGQVTKRARWMPWQPEAMKDVVACDKLRLGGKQPFDPEISEWGNPPVVRRVSPTESIGR